MTAITFNNMRFYVFMQRDGKTELVATFAARSFAQDFADDGFTCLRKDEICEVHKAPSGELFVFCSGHGEVKHRDIIRRRNQTHLLEGQLDYKAGTDSLIGFYPLSSLGSN